MSSNINTTPENWRNYSTKIPISAMRIQRGDLKRLYKIVNDKQIEYKDLFMPVLSPVTNESAEEFELRKKRVSDAFVTSMTVHGANGEMTHGNNESFLEETTLPEQVRSIFFSTGSVPQAVLGFAPLCKIVVFLDFTRPPLLDFSSLPTLPTPNETNFEITADNETWFAASRARLLEFFEERKTGVNWLHRAAMYDVILFLVALPITIWVCYRMSIALDSSAKLHPLMVGAILIYTFLFCLNAFRAIFSYSRWVFPKIEMDSERSRSTPLRHRAAWSVIVLGILAAILYDAAKYIIAN